MLKLKQITKNYVIGENTVEALKGIDVEFRKNEFVSILGPSGCGKTTMLNIIGGLDQYTSGDLEINGVSTKEYADSDWDSYRNRSIGFVFQSYNLIPHLTVLSNVELALTLSGVSKEQRRKRAVDILEKVGLGDQINKKPNQMSGGQMQRVSIARALINNPDIILADEPTGALDSETSLQIMALLKDIANDRLVIMVTHNSDLANEYSTRVIRLLDGKVTDDSNPYQSNVAKPKMKKERRRKADKKTSMSMGTALSLSFNNLMTKKARTFLTAFAGSIGIIGIALILAISTGVQEYISGIEEDTLSSYPLMIQENATDIDSLMSSMMTETEKTLDHDLDQIYSNDIMSSMVNTMVSETEANNLGDFKAYIESGESEIDSLTSDIQYIYSTQMNIYKADTSDGITQVNPSTIFDSMGFSSGSSSSTDINAVPSSMLSMGGTDVWNELIGSDELLSSQYDVIAGHMPENYDEVVVIVDENNEISDYTLYSLGLKDTDELEQLMTNIMMGEEPSLSDEQTIYTYEELLSLEYKLLINTDYYENENGIWTDRSEDEDYMKSVIEDALTVKVVGILRPSTDAAMMSVTGSVGYTTELMEYLINEVNESEIVKAQIADQSTDVFTGLSFTTDDDEETAMTSEEFYAYIATLPEDQQLQAMGAIQQMQDSGMDDAQIIETLSASMKPEASDATYALNLALLGVSDLNKPSAINIYPTSFDAKENIAEIISEYNTTVDEENAIKYTDYIGLMMSSVTTIINAISYILIAFVAISLVVSSIMIGIITYISVLERTKEIGILRAIGASKGNISRVFNAETLIVGFTSGILGIGLTLLLTIPINAIIRSLAGITATATLPPVAAVILVVISMLLTFIAGLIPSRLAAKKDPVIALRTE